MRKFTPDELREFLVAVDGKLSRREQIIVVGGGAIALAGGVRYSTKDIDTLHSLSRTLERAFADAREETGLPVPTGHSSVSEAPYDAAERLVAVMPELAHLEVLALEPHDAALSKTLRGLGKDFDAIEALHEAHPLDQATLVSRYTGELREHAIGDRRRHDVNFAILIHRLFGEVAYEEICDRFGLPMK